MLNSVVAGTQKMLALLRFLGFFLIFSKLQANCSMHTISGRSDLIPFSAWWHSNLYLSLLDSMPKLVDLLAFLCWKDWEGICCFSYCTGSLCSKNMWYMEQKEKASKKSKNITSWREHMLRRQVLEGLESGLKTMHFNWNGCCIKG